MLVLKNADFGSDNLFDVEPEGYVEGEKMPTDEKRREVARRLRILATHSEVDKEYVEDAIGLYMGECVDGYDPVSVTELADFIEPEPEQTCEDISTEYGKFECSNCGCRITDTTCVDNGRVYFCPDCGRAVENAD